VRWHDLASWARVKKVLKAQGDLDGDSWALVELSENMLRHEAARAGKWYKINNRGDKVDTPPPRAVVQDMLACPPALIELPHLLRNTETPVFASSGELVQKAGYHEPSGIYYHPPKGLVIKEVSAIPTPEEVAAAKELVDDLLRDFPFIKPSEKAGAWSIFIEPFARELIHGPTPLRMIEASQPGSGKTLLADVLTMHVTKPAIIAQCKSEEEWNKSIIAQLRASAPIIQLDNLSGALESGVLAAALTSEYYGGRLLGTNETAQYPNKSLWIATANNPTMTTEIARRTIRIRLNPGIDKPWQRDNFTHKELREWAAGKKEELIWAALTIVQNWIALGRPSPGCKSLGSFESWSRVIGGILESAGVEGFLSNLDEFYRMADQEGANWRNLVKGWAKTYGAGAEKKVAASNLFSLLGDLDFDLGYGNERSQRMVFGKLLAKQRDRVIGEYTIKYAGMSGGKPMWALIQGEVGNLFFEDED
jgi:putative DNA primase/helicase